MHETLVRRFEIKRWFCTNHWRTQNGKQIEMRFGNKWNLFSDYAAIFICSVAKKKKLLKFRNWTTISIGCKWNTIASKEVVEDQLKFQIPGVRNWVQQQPNKLYSFLFITWFTHTYIDITFSHEFDFIITDIAAFQAS